ncbi:hypothetical protein BDN67DRAFT_1017888 [Paxillus ammoniavirescens]|nr:hypothetical protein BDN67DRAFT_1017888 [Paxillus ammoniavirescens]
MRVHAVQRLHSEPLPSPVQHLLFVPEVVDVIFNFLDRKTNLTNAFVCKQWSQIALDVVWKEVDNLIQLFSLLKPICRVLCQPERAEYLFEAMPDANGWLRFKRYASRVRCLRFRSIKYTLDINCMLDDVA